MPEHPLRSRALDLLRVGTRNPNATFRDGQWDAIRHLADGDGRLLVVQKTGWGKSFVYFIATKLLREASNGPTLLISPLLALMRNQIEAASRMGVVAETINSTNQDDWHQVAERVRRHEVDILLISPERLANAEFQATVLDTIASRVGMVVIDEAHCISDWGHDFRPQYRQVERLLRRLPAQSRLLATTATANDRVIADLHDVLGDNLTITRGDLARPSLTLQAIGLDDHAERLAWLADHLGDLPGSGIIYALTKADAYRIAAWLESKGHIASAYTGGDENDERIALEQALLQNQVKALVATSALGMGFDKPDLGFVIHFQVPGSVVTYYQQVGRAGRGIDHARGILLYGSGDSNINTWFINNAFPEREHVSEITNALRGASLGLSVPELEREVNVRKHKIEHALALLSLESPSPIAKDGPKWKLTAAPLSDTFWERVDRITELRHGEQAQMQSYCTLPFGSHMGFLIDALDGGPLVVTTPTLPELPAEVRPETVLEAVDFLRRSHLRIEPRAQWPARGLASIGECGVRGKIAPERRFRQGRSLGYWSDAGWGAIVRQSREAGYFGDELVDAAASMYRQWEPYPPPALVTCVPSRRRPELVKNFAQRLAEALNMPFIEALSRVSDGPEQREKNNSSQKALNIDGAFAVNQSTVGRDDSTNGPVLLVDDLVNSRWTITVCAWLLYKSGTDCVYPLTLAQVGSDE